MHHPLSSSPSPHPSEALLRLSHAALQSRRPQEAIELARRAVSLDARHLASHLMLAQALRRAGAPLEAMALCEQVLGWAPHPVPVLTELALAQRHADRLADAEATYRRALTIEDHHAALHHNLANLLQRRQARSEAEHHYRQAIALMPGMAEAHTELGNLLVSQAGRETEGRLCYAQALAVRPDFLPAWQRLNASLASGDVASGLLALQQQAGHLQASTQLMHSMADAALRLDPANPLGHYAKGMALRLQGDLQSALPWLEQAWALPETHPLHRQSVFMHTISLMEMGENGRAIEGARRLLALAVDDAERAKAHQLLGGLVLEQGQADQAIALYRQAVTLDPGFLPSRISLCAAHLYAEGDLAMQQALIAKALIGGMLDTAPAAPHANAPQPERRLRIGYLSGDFRQHSCAYFLAPLLRHHRASACEVYAYATELHEDHVTERLRAMVGESRWRRAAALSDDALAQAIRADGIDILVDLAGLTDGNRLKVLAMKPAPVILNWLGFLGSNGLAAMDGRITDDAVDPDGGTDAGAAGEPALRLPRPYLCYEPPETVPDVMPPPMLQRGYATFGSFNSLAKLSDACVANWAAVLQAIPGSRLMVKSKALKDEGMQAALRARLSAQGIASDRVILEGWRPHTASHLQAYGDVDVALDSSPFNGVTTTCEASWMGVPVVSLVGRSPAERQGLTLLTALGRPELAVHSRAELVAACQALIADPQKLAEDRLSARARMQASPLMNGPDFAVAMESAYRQAWQQWCQRMG
ncbi:MAG: tetratricopeptide repeat protein [Aquabacterium sp.]